MTDILLQLCLWHLCLLISFPKLALQPINYLMIANAWRGVGWCNGRFKSCTDGKWTTRQHYVALGDQKRTLRAGEGAEHTLEIAAKERGSACAMLFADRTSKMRSATTSTDSCAPTTWLSCRQQGEPQRCPVPQPQTVTGLHENSIQSHKSARKLNAAGKQQRIGLILNFGCRHLSRQWATSLNGGTRRFWATRSATELQAFTGMLGGCWPP